MLNRKLIGDLLQTVTTLKADVDPRRSNEDFEAIDEIIRQAKAVLNAEDVELGLIVKSTHGSRYVETIDSSGVVQGVFPSYELATTFRNGWGAGRGI